MDVGRLLKILEQARTTRDSVYLNERRIYRLFRDKVSRINRIIVSKELGPEFTAGLGSILGVKISGKKGISEDLDISFDEKALLIEIFEKERGNMHSVEDSKIPKGALLSYVGESHITLDFQDVTPETSMLPHNLTEKVQRIREFQAKGSKEGTIVWSSKSKKYLASIAYMEFVIDPGIAHSNPKGRYGILGTKEDELEGLLTISPRWIWYEGEN